MKFYVEYFVEDECGVIATILTDESASAIEEKILNSVADEDGCILICGKKLIEPDNKDDIVVVAFEDHVKELKDTYVFTTWR